MLWLMPCLVGEMVQKKKIKNKKGVYICICILFRNSTVYIANYRFALLGGCVTGFG